MKFHKKQKQNPEKPEKCVKKAEIKRNVDNSEIKKTEFRFKPENSHA